MLSSREETQKRMLSNKVISPKNTKLSSMANIANRSPTNRFENKNPITTTTLSSKKQLLQTSQKRETIPHPPISPRSNLRNNLNSPKQSNYQLNQSQMDSPYIERPLRNDNGSFSSRLEVRPAVSKETVQEIGLAEGLVGATYIDVKLSNGDTYKGEVLKDKYHGIGSYYFLRQNLIYQGQFRYGKQHGQGVLRNVATNQQIYEGAWEKGMKSGQGTYTYIPNVQYYNGPWLNDEKHGDKGFYYFRGGTYSGDWNRNRATGSAMLKLEDGTQFKGKFEGGHFIHGLVKYPNDDEYSGSMKDNKRHCQEAAYYCKQSKIRYKGGYWQDRKNGKGTLIYQNGDELTGIFENDKLNENQVVSLKWFNRNVIFQGWFRNGQPHKGTVTRSDGSKYEI